MPEHRIPDQLVHSISARLRPACSHIPEAEFEQLVRTIALTQWKYEHLSPDERHRLAGAHAPREQDTDAESSAA
jgi:hypothetical protein